MPGFPIDFQHVRFRYEAWPPPPSIPEKTWADEWLKEVRKVLWQVYSRNYTGMAVIDAIRTNARDVTVIVTPSEASGKRSDEVRVEYNPFSVTQKKGCQLTGLQADEALIHALAHAWRKANGTATTQGSLEEFFAILITDVYLSEKGRNPLCGTDSTAKRGEIKPNWYTSEGFLSEHPFYARLRRLCSTEMELFQRIRSADRPRFNPIREYLKNRAMWDRKMHQA